MLIRSKAGGFSLIELMIVVAIIGIIAAIAFPSYQNNVRETRRATAQADLMALAQWMERQYSGDFSYLEGGNQPVLPYSESPQSGGASVFYNVSFSGSVTQNSFTLMAVPAGDQANDRCGTLLLDQAGTRSATKGGTTVSDCW
ncbi:type IV pilin protein [Marinobacter shengliensis]|jgi:type IV pilus assembly protein PilE|uniref:type IV pilin protein n=1 Tax=Marinobacter shengliensis TaxID=1389223 RepID=UPI0035B91D2D